MDSNQLLIPGRLRFVLVGTSHPGNVGASARAMQVMGLDALLLAAPECDPQADEARAMAVGAAAYDAMRVLPDLDAALADCRLVLGCTARRRRVALPELDPAAAATALVQAAREAPVALLFGRERTGLENDELQRCHAAVHIPTDPGFSSLNLAAAVQVMAYEVRRVALAAGASAPPAVVVPREADAEPPATQDVMERFFAHLDETLVDIDFHKGRQADNVMRRLRRLFLRAQPDEREVRILRGILAEAQRMARIATRR